VWTFVLALVSVSGDFFYKVSAATLAILVCGCAAFSIGSAIAQYVWQPQSAPSYDLRVSNRTITWTLFAVACGAPFAYKWILGAASELAGSNFFLQAYSVMNRTLEEDELPRIVGNVISFASITALLCFRERVDHAKRALFALILALSLLAMTGGRSGIVIMILAVVAIDWLRAGRPSFKMIGGLCAVLLILVTALAIFVRKGEASENASLSENVTPVVQGLALYAAGGVPAFSQVVESPNIIPHNWHTYTPLLRTLNQFGLRTEIPPQSSEFLSIGPSGLTGNVYTAYFAYKSDFGLVGALLLLVFLGFATTRVYQHALIGGRIATIAYGYLFAAMILSPFSDYFFMTLSSSLRLVAFSWIVYSLPIRWREFWVLCPHPDLELECKIKS
jgi:oligosaccharide repeat unit polymerase